MKPTAIALCLGLTACASAPMVSKDHFLQEFPATGSVEFCSKTEVFRKCTTLTENQCLNLARTSIHSCAKEFESQMPERLQQPGDGRLWGTKIGACAGQAFFTNLQTSKPDRIDQTCLEQEADNLKG